MKKEKDLWEVGFDRYFENSVSLLCILDGNGNLVKINQKWLDTFGYKSAEIERKPVVCFVHPNDLEKVHSVLHQTNITKKTQESILRLQHKNGDYLWIECSPFHIDNLTYLSARDVSQTKQMEENYRNLTNIHKTVVDAITIGLLYAKNSKMVWANNAFLKMFHCSVEEIQGKPLSFFYKRKYRYNTIRNEALTTLSKNQVFAKEIEVQTNGSDIRWILFTGKALDPNKPADGTVWIIQDITRNKKARHALEKSEAVLKATMESISDGMLVVDSDKKITHHNTRFREIFSIPLDLMQTKNDFLLIDHAKKQLTDNHTFKTEIASIYDSAKSTEDLLHFSDGRIFERHSFPLKENRKAKGRVWFFRDITEKKNNEETLLKSQTMLKNAQRIAKLGSMELDLIAQSYSFSDEVYRIFGLNPDQAKPSLIFFIRHIHPNDRSALTSYIRETINRKDQKEIQFKIIRPDGSIRHLTFAGEYSLNASGEPCSFLGIIQDITELITIEKNLKEQEIKLRKTLSFAPAAIGIYKNNIFVECNEEFYRMTGFNPREIIGQPTHVIIPDVEYQLVVNAYLHHLNKKEIFNIETAWKRKDGTLIEILLRIAPLFHTETENDRFIFSALDITSLKQALKKITKLNSELEEKVLLRTAELEIANKDLEAFAYSVSHDLRAPLRHIDGFSRLMYASLQDPEPKTMGYYEKTCAAATRMSNMINDLLDFSRIGRKELNLSTVDVSLIIKEIIHELKPDIKKSNIEWKLHPVFPAQADPAMIKLVFENLISNAIKYSSTKAKSIIEIGSKMTKKRVEFYVKDNGIGFDMEFVDKLFGVFQRLHTDEEFEGIGIGLANVKQIVKKHGGTVWAKAKKNQGATFYLTLPTTNTI